MAYCAIIFGGAMQSHFRSMFPRYRKVPWIPCPPPPHPDQRNYASPTVPTSVPSDVQSLTSRMIECVSLRPRRAGPAPIGGQLPPWLEVVSWLVWCLQSSLSCRHHLEAAFYCLQAGMRSARLLKSLADRLT